MDLPQTVSWRDRSTPTAVEADSSSFTSANGRRARLSKRPDPVRAESGRRLTQAEENQLFAKQMQIQVFMRSIGLSRPEAELFWAEHYASPPEESSVDDQRLEQHCEPEVVECRARVQFNDEVFERVKTFEPVFEPLVLQRATITIVPSTSLLSPTRSVVESQSDHFVYPAVQPRFLLALAISACQILTRLVPSRSVCRLPCGQSVCHGRAYTSSLPIT